MTEAGAAMRRVLEERARHSLTEERLASLAALAGRVRELTEAVVFTEVDDAEAAAVAAEVGALTRRLAAARRPVPPIVEVGGTGVVRQVGSPVTGELNPIAPPLPVIVAPDGTARSEFTLGVVYEGPPGFVHGGVAAMVLDQLSGTAAAANGTPGMTAGLDVRYRRPTPHSVPLTAEAKVARVEGRKTFVGSRIAGPDGRTTAEATAVFIMPSS